MKNRFLILCLVLATLFACSSDSMGVDGLDETAEKRSAVPFKVKKLSGTYALGGNATCATLTAIGEGTVSHLGKSALLEEWCFNRDINDLGTRTVTFTAANGDELYGEIYDFSLVGQIEDGGLIFTEEVKIIGRVGDGRFEDASGNITQTVEISDPSLGSGTFTYSAEGTISY